MQLSMMRDIYESGYKHDVYFATSGGAVSTFALVAGMFTPTGIDRVVQTLDERYIFKNWSYFPLIPPWLAGYTKGSVFNLSPYLLDNLSTFITPSMARNVEMWIGTASISTGNGMIFCSKSDGETIITPKINDNHHTKYEVQYLDGDINNLIKAVISSATIPMLIPASEINGKYYVDGGLRAASPLSFLASSIDDSKSLHIDYLSPGDNTKPVYDDKSNNSNITERMIKTLQETTRTMSIIDNQHAIRLITGNSTTEPDLSGNCSRDELVHILTGRSSYYKSCLILCPEGNPEVGLLDLTSAKVRKLIDKTSHNYNYRLWIK